MAGNHKAAHSARPDPILEKLNAVSQRLASPEFLRQLSASQLPSAAVSESSLSPTREEARPRPHPSRLMRAAALDNEIKNIDLIAPLLQEPCLDDVADTPDPQVVHKLESAFVGARYAFQTMAAERSFQTFSHGHQDIVLAVDFNYFGTRMVTASSDHRLKVWDKKDDSWNLVESWKAHDAEIVDAKWNGPFMGEIIGSIGEDGRCKLWQEDDTEVALSGNRFKMIYSLSSLTNSPFVSLDFKNIMQETWLALITRDGYLTVYEPQDQCGLNEWTIMAERWVSEDHPPERQEEVGFKVVFHKEKLPCWTAITAGLDRKSLSLAVAAMKDVLVFRTDKAKRFFQVAKLTGARQVIRDLAWANGSMRGYDILATASKDGAIRIYELATAAEDLPSPPESSSPGVGASVPPRPGHMLNTQSGIGAGLAGAAQRPTLPMEIEQHPGRINQEVILRDELTGHHGAVWRVAFSQMGDLLVTTGDDASIRTWKQAANGHWMEYAQIETAQDN